MYYEIGRTRRKPETNQSLQPPQKTTHKIQDYKSNTLERTQQKTPKITIKLYND